MFRPYAFDAVARCLYALNKNRPMGHSRTRPQRAVHTRRTEAEPFGGRHKQSLYSRELLPVTEDVLSVHSVLCRRRGLPPVTIPWSVCLVWGFAIVSACRGEAGETRGLTSRAIEWRGYRLMVAADHEVSAESDRLRVYTRSSSGRRSSSGMTIGIGAEHPNVSAAFEKRQSLCAQRLEGCRAWVDKLAGGPLHCVATAGNGPEAEAHRLFFCKIAGMDLYGLGSCDLRISRQCEGLLDVLKTISQVRSQ